MTRILTIIALLFASPVGAEEMLMDCRGKVFRHVEGIFENSVDARVDGEWQPMHEARNYEHWSVTKHEYKIKDRAIITETEAVRTTDNEYFPKGTIATNKEFLDFQLLKASGVTIYSNGEKEQKREVECKKF